MSRLCAVQPDELALLGWSWLLVFSLMSAYYVIRPIRDEMGVQGGVENLQWLFTATLLAMLALNPAFAALVRRMPRRRFISVTYLFFAANLLAFVAAFTLASPAQQVWVGRAFFVWTSVFNLFVVSVFWALMVDVFDPAQGKRLFGFLAAGATVGAIVGSSITASLVEGVGTTRLLFASIALLGVAVACVHRLAGLSTALARHGGAPHDSGTGGGGAAATGGSAGAGSTGGGGNGTPIGGSVWAGLTHAVRSPYLIGICAYMLLFSITSTLLYFEQAGIASQHFADRAARTRFFASIDLAVNAATLLVQLFVTARVLRRYGVAVTASVLPVLSAIGFAALAIAPTVTVLVLAQVSRRVGNFGLARPTRELLFTVLSREDKYKAKNAIDTVVYRTGDQVGSWSYALLGSAGLGMTVIALLAVAISLAWLADSFWLGRRQEAMARGDAAHREHAQQP
ncbi:MAG: MFS transporter [Burkholderiales bacterium 70-64]|nr:MAG: MFS transporter [Burkholderiales bacterium 70-64]